MNNSIYVVPVLTNAHLLKSVTYSFKQFNGTTTTYKATSVPFALVSAFSAGTPFGYETVVTVTAVETNFAVAPGQAAPACAVNPKSFTIKYAGPTELVEHYYTVVNQGISITPKTFNQAGSTALHNTPGNGAVTYNTGTGKYDYVPTTDFIGNDTFQYASPKGDIVTIIVHVAEIDLPEANDLDPDGTSVDFTGAAANCTSGTLLASVFVLVNMCPGPDYNTVVDTLTYDLVGNTTIPGIGVLVATDSDTVSIANANVGQYLVGNYVIASCPNPNYLAGEDGGVCNIGGAAANPVAFTIQSPIVYTDPLNVLCQAYSVAIYTDEDATSLDNDNVLTHAINVTGASPDLTTNTYTWKVYDDDGVTELPIGTANGFIGSITTSNGGKRVVIEVNEKAVAGNMTYYAVCYANINGFEVSNRLKVTIKSDYTLIIFGQCNNVFALNCDTGVITTTLAPANSLRKLDPSGPTWSAVATDTYYMDVNIDGTPSDSDATGTNLTYTLASPGVYDVNYSVKASGGAYDKLMGSRWKLVLS